MKCRTCCRPVSAPYRRYGADGKVLEGCVDSDHTGHLVSPSASADWHRRPAAKRIRQAIDKTRR